MSLTENEFLNLKRGDIVTQENTDLSLEFICFHQFSTANTPHGAQFLKFESRYAGVNGHYMSAKLEDISKETLTGFSNLILKKENVKND